MRRATTLATALVMFSTVAAGCLQPAPQEGAGVSPSSEPASGQGEKNGALAPTSSAPPPTQQPGTNNATPQPKPVVKTIDYSGTTDTQACEFVVVTGTCETLVSGPYSWRDLSPGGQPLRLSAVVTWTAATDVTKEITAMLAEKTTNGWKWSASKDPWATGASPLKLDWPLTNFTAGTNWVLVIYAGTFVGQGVDPVFVGAELDVSQDFDLKGTITSIPQG